MKRIPVLLFVAVLPILVLAACVAVPQAPVAQERGLGGVTSVGLTATYITSTNASLTNATITSATVTTGTLTALTVSGATALNGGLSVDTSAFSVANTTGNTVISGTLDVDDTANLDNVDVDGSLNLIVNTEHVGAMTILAVPITYTAAAGGTGTVATIADGEIWFVHAVLVRTTTNFDCTGDDCTLTIGDGNDADGFIVAADANLQAAFTEATGFAAGWFGIENGSAGAYTTDDGGPFVYAPSGAAETIDWVLDETDGETYAAGAATIYVLYTRIQ